MVACPQHLPAGRYVKTITVLDLEGNNFRGIPEALRGAQQLSHLDLSCNHDLQIGLQDVHILLQLHSLNILDLSKVSERLPLEGPPLPNEVGCSPTMRYPPLAALDPSKTWGWHTSLFLMSALAPSRLALRHDQTGARLAIASGHAV